ncbi:zf-TFIIB domain-containing protein [Alteromonas genovensis]|uniref:zf-TFIIB domain-containing protein n=1 Tax=Alteromonas genovensis TaxID=471225 RepID=UPI002FE07C7D
MKCPRTHTTLKQVSVGKVPVYYSEACGGVLLENNTLSHFENPQDKRGNVLAKHLSQFHCELVSKNKRIRCPKCPDTVMLQRFYSPLHAVEIDECPGCGAIWLDTGELGKIQSLMLNEKERALLRNELMKKHERIEIKGMPHQHDNWNRRSDKVDAFFDLASYISNSW